MSTFLSDSDLKTLTGYAVKGKQAAQLRKMGIPFFLNGCGRPVVTVAAVEGRKVDEEKAWTPGVLKTPRRAA